jgi:hypothetical protein
MVPQSLHRNACAVPLLDDDRFHRKPFHFFQLSCFTMLYNPDTESVVCPVSCISELKSAFLGMYAQVMRGRVSKRNNSVIVINPFKCQDAWTDRKVNRFLSWNYLTKERMCKSGCREFNAKKKVTTNGVFQISFCSLR